MSDKLTGLGIFRAGAAKPFGIHSGENHSDKFRRQKSACIRQVRRTVRSPTPFVGLENQEPDSDAVEATSQGHQNLLAMVYEELRGLAAARMAAQPSGHTLQPTALVHEAWLRLSKTDACRWNDREHFFRAAAVAMRRILVDHARAKARHKRRPDDAVVESLMESAPDCDHEDDILLIHECLGELEKTDPDCARVVQLKFFAGLTNKEAAGVLGVSLSSVDRQWAFARSQLFQMIRRRREARVG